MSLSTDKIPQPCQAKVNHNRDIQLTVLQREIWIQYPNVSIPFCDHTGRLKISEYRVERKRGRFIISIINGPICKDTLFFNDALSTCLEIVEDTLTNP